MPIFGRWLALPLLLTAALPASAATPRELASWRQQAARVTIVRDDWGIAHVRGKSDADAVFGMIYAQAEDDFNRIEMNYLTALGRTAEAEGETAIWADLRARLYMEPIKLQQLYRASPGWLQRLMDAWADGLNYYLATHPNVHPRAIVRFEPWMALSFTEGSIGGDIERIELPVLEAFYGAKGQAALANPISRHAELDSASMPPDQERAQVWMLKQVQGDGKGRDRELEPSGSNGIAIAPSNTADGHALLLINPHTSFFFRSELQMTSDDGLDAYGAATWGQFFIYQGFNAHAGWMHTSSGVDAVDEFVETIVRRGDRIFYRYGKRELPVGRSTVTIRYRAGDGAMADRSFTIYRTRHGPIVRAEGDKWVAFAMMDKPIEALQQSFLRTKAVDYASFAKVAALQANSSNNTIFADDKGEIAYLHPQFIPRRDDRFDYTKPVDGSDPSTDWRGLLPLVKIPHLYNPASGWLYNSNNWPWTAAGAGSPRQSAFPRYVDSYGENPRGLHAMRLLEGRKDFTLDRLQQAAFDSYQPAFAMLIPGLVRAWDEATAGPIKARLAEPIMLLRDWDDRWGAGSVPMSLAAFWADEMWQRAAAAEWEEGLATYHKIDRASSDQKLEALAAALDRLQRDFGHWAVPWGEINRFQRLTDDIVHPFTDAGPSIPVPFASARWGSLASFGARPYPGTKRWYGTSGNSFVAVVEFGDRVKARAVTAGGESGNPSSPHFNDEAARYASGELRDVYFYPDQIKAHTERAYRPGE